MDFEWKSSEYMRKIWTQAKTFFFLGDCWDLWKKCFVSKRRPFILFTFFKLVEFSTNVNFSESEQSLGIFLTRNVKLMQCMCEILPVFGQGFCEIGQILEHIWAKVLQIWASLGRCCGQICTYPNQFGQFCIYQNLKGNAGYKWAYAKFMKCFYAGLEQQFFK